MKKEVKDTIIAELGAKLKEYPHFYIVDLAGLNAEATSNLRRKCFKNEIKMIVVKNTLLSRAAKEAGIDGLDFALEGTTALALSNEDHIAPARILCKFAETHDFFKVKSGFIDGQVATVEEITELAKLPSKEVLIAKALGGLNAPITGFVTVLNGTIKGLVVALNAIAEKQSA